MSIPSQLSAMAHAIRAEAREHGLSLSSSHTHEVMATAMGFGKKAALDAFIKSLPVPLPPDNRLGAIIDPRAASDRAVSLGCPPTQLDVLGKVLSHHLDEVLDLGSHGFDLPTWLDDQIADLVANSDEAYSAQAETNATFDEIEIEYELNDLMHDLAKASHGGNGQIRIPFDATMAGAADPEKMFSGDKVSLSGTVTLRVLAGNVVEVSDWEIDGAAKSLDYLEQEESLPSAIMHGEFGPAPAVSRQAAFTRVSRGDQSKHEHHIYKDGDDQLVLCDAGGHPNVLDMGSWYGYSDPDMPRDPYESSTGPLWLDPSRAVERYWFEGRNPMAPYPRPAMIAAMDPDRPRWRYALPVVTRDGDLEIVHVTAAEITRIEQHAGRTLPKNWDPAEVPEAHYWSELNRPMV